MKRVLLVILLILCLCCIASCNDGKDDPTNNNVPEVPGNPPATTGEIVFSVNNEAMMRIDTTKSSGSITISAPNSIKATYCVGWQATVNNNVVFLPVGGTYAYQQNDSAVFIPVYLEATTGFVTQLKFSQEQNGIAYTFQCPSAQWNTLTSLATDVSCGFVVALESDVSSVKGKITHDALTAANVAFTDVVASLVSSEDSSVNSFSGVLQNILPQNYWYAYTALGYIKITYADGTTRYMYSDYGKNGAPSSSARQLASEILTSLTPDAYQALTEEERQWLDAYAKIRILVEKDSKSPGGLGFDLNRYHVQAINDYTASCEELWRSIMNLLPINHECALYITAKDGFLLSEATVAAVVYTNGTAISDKRYCITYHEGAMVISYTSYTPSV